MNPPGGVETACEGREQREPARVVALVQRSRTLAQVDAGAGVGAFPSALGGRREPLGRPGTERGVRLAEFPPVEGGLL